MSSSSSSSVSAQSYAITKKKRQQKLKQVRKKMESKLNEEGFVWDNHVVPLKLSIEWLTLANQNSEEYYPKLIELIESHVIESNNNKIHSIQDAMNHFDTLPPEEQAPLQPFIENLKNNILNLKINNEMIKKNVTEKLDECGENHSYRVIYTKRVTIEDSSYIIFEKVFLSKKQFETWKRMNNKIQKEQIEVKLATN